MTRERPSPARRPAESKRAGATAPPASGSRKWQGYDAASRVMADILAGLVVWGGIGWLADRWLGTDPWLLSIGIMGGFAGGLYLVWARSKHELRGPEPSTAAEDDTDTEA